MFSSSFLPQYSSSLVSPPSLQPYQVYNIDDESPSPGQTEPPSDENVNNESYGASPDSFFGHFPGEKSGYIPYFAHQALTAHNRRMIIPYKKILSRNSPNNRVTTSTTSTGLAFIRDDPLVMYRFYEFHCSSCNQSWLSPLYRAKEGLYCRICHQFCTPRGTRHSFTPYLGKETCYGKYLCHNCNRGFSSYKSLSNCPDPCFLCGTLVYPYYQIAHSVLYQKIRKNDTAAMFEHFGSTATSNQRGAGSADTSSSPPKAKSTKARNFVRKITSGIISTVISTKQPSNHKKRLHCFNNTTVQLKVGRRQLKTCYSEPTIGTNSF